MQFSIVLLVLGTSVTLTLSRPSSVLEGNDSETGEAEYEANDDTAADEYHRDEQEPAVEEAQHKSVRREDVMQEPQEPGDGGAGFDRQSAQDRDTYETISENSLGFRKQNQHHDITDVNNNRGYQSQKESTRNDQLIDETNNAGADDFYSHRSNNKQIKQHSETLLNGRSVNINPDYGEMLFKMKSAEELSGRQQKNIAEEAKEKTNMDKQYNYNNMHARSRDQDGENRYDNTYNYDRDRRDVENSEVKQISETTSPTNEKEDNENAIINNIKKLSEQDLEELLNSLPDDKRALLKKIMDKREITKKAGAVDENSLLEGGQSDTSKVEGAYSVDSITESSLSSNSHETSKQPESGEVASSKTSDSEGGSAASGSKSEIINNTDIKDDKSTIREESDSSNAASNDAVGINSDPEVISKNENKREAKNRDSTNDKLSLEDSKISDYQFAPKDLNTFSLNQDICSENEDLFNNEHNDPKESNGHVESYKREISQQETSAVDDVNMKSLEDSFPASNSYDDNNLESEMLPLIRVKRTVKDHHVKKRDSPLLSNVQFSPELQSDVCENEEKSEFEDYRTSNHASKLARNYNEVKSRNNKQGTSSANGDTQRQSKMSLGSDNDSVLSGIEGVDDNLMYNSELRGKRTLDNLNDNADKMNLKRSGRTAGPMDIDAVSDNSIKIPSQYQEDEAFGSLLRNPEKDFSQFKRIRQAKQVADSARIN